MAFCELTIIKIFIYSHSVHPLYRAIVKNMDNQAATKSKSAKIMPLKNLYSHKKYSAKGALLSAMFNPFHCSMNQQTLWNTNGSHHVPTYHQINTFNCEERWMWHKREHWYDHEECIVCIYNSMAKSTSQAGVTSNSKKKLSL